jgi:CRP-like cAMP-binding protein
MIVDEELLRLLKSNTLFRGIPFSEVKPYFKPKNFFQVKEGETIYSLGSNAEEIFLIVEGEVKLKFSEPRRIEKKYILDFFGEAEVIDNCKRYSIAVANNNCILYRISSSEVMLLARDHEILNRNLRKIAVQKESFNRDLEDDKVKNTLDTEPDIQQKYSKINFDDEEKDKSLSDEELDSLVRCQKAGKEINGVLKEATDIQDVGQLDLEN